MQLELQYFRLHRNRLRHETGEFLSTVLVRVAQPHLVKITLGSLAILFYTDGCAFSLFNHLKLAVVLVLAC